MPRVPLAPLILSVSLGILAGIGGYTFSYAKGLSYFSTDPRACANCHIMEAEYMSWQMASHHASAVCIDCHLPHDFVPKYLAKAENGYRHGKLFTTGGFKEPIEVQARGKEILQENCLRCHGELVEALIVERPGAGAQGPHPHDSGTGSNCIRCHAGAGHGVRAALGGPLTEQERKTPSAK